MKTHTTTSIRYCLLAAAILCLSASFSHAAVAIDPVEDGGFTTASAALTWGWSFTATSNINVTALGYSDFGRNGLAFDHPVGIWANGGALLGSVTVTKSDPITDGFRYVASPSIALLAGQTYVIGGFQPGSFPVPGDLVLTQGGGYSSFTTAPEISYIGNRFVLAASLSRPDATTSSVAGGIFGPNFQFEDAGTAVPEPSTALWGMLVLGVCVREAFGRGRRSTDAQ